MNLSNLFSELRKDPEYRTAEKELQFRLQIADAVVDARIAKGWTQTDLAAKIGTKQANISRLECATANPTLAFLEKLFLVLDIHFAIWPNNQPCIEQPILSSRQSENSDLVSMTRQESTRYLPTVKKVVEVLE